tara:strand:- start:3226 stop:3723 length:498 start_codon:yes stop_codon:yes gene_type:complete
MTKIIKFNPKIYKKKAIKEYEGFESSFIFKINKLSSRLKRYSVRNFRKYDLGNPELIIISLIGQINQKVTVKDLSNVHWMDKGLISRASINLIKMKILRKVNSKIDKRSHTLELTNSGKKIYEELYLQKRDRYQKLTENLSVEELNIFQKLLDKITSNSEIHSIK